MQEPKQKNVQNVGTKVHLHHKSSNNINNPKERSNYTARLGERKINGRLTCYS